MSRSAAAKHLLVILFVLALSCLDGPDVAAAQSSPSTDLAPVVQTATGTLDERGMHFYDLPALRAGDVLYVYVANVSGNLDPAAGITDAAATPDELRSAILGEYDRLRQADEDPVTALRTFFSQRFLAANDDAGAGHDAAFQFEIPADGDYRLFVTSSPLAPSFGEYRLLLGLNAPEALTGAATPHGEAIAYVDAAASFALESVQEISGTVQGPSHRRVYELSEFRAGDTVYATTEVLSGTLRPTLGLYAATGKLRTASNWTGNAASASLSYTFDASSRGDQLVVIGCCEDSPTEGTFRLLLGVNAPGVLGGDAEPAGDPIVKPVREIEIGVQIEQIIGVDQTAENFDVVAVMAAWWDDPTLAFDPSDCNCQVQEYPIATVNNFIDKANPWPGFSIVNQQGNRWTQNRGATVLPDGSAYYGERFSTKLQAPDFDFRAFPFDRQLFRLRIQTFQPEDVFVLKPRPGFSRYGTQLGEEEWVVVEDREEVITLENTYSSYVYTMIVRRNLIFYVFRIFTPLAIIILLTYLTFSMKNYDSRVSLSSGNLLLFIAFNFTIGNELPRLGYLTFMDTILIICFVITGLMVVINVAMRRAEAAGRDKLIQRVDKIGIWLYPLTYIVLYIGLFIYFVAGSAPAL